MKMVIQLQDENILSFMRRAGYGFQKEGSGEIAFVRRVGQSPFPRFHVYTGEADSPDASIGIPTQSRRDRKPIADSTKAIVINLHIDQKQPTYGSGHAHSGEYDGPAIVAELERLRVLAVAAPPVQPKLPEEKKGFFGKLFG